MWLFGTVTSAVFREIRASLLPASLEYTAYGHWGPYTLHTFKSDIEEQTPPTMTAEYNGICEYTLVKFYAVAA